MPGPALEVIEAEFFLELLIALLDFPPGVRGDRELAQERFGREVGKVVFKPVTELLDQEPAFHSRPAVVAHKEYQWFLAPFRIPALAVRRRLPVWGK